MCEIETGLLGVLGDAVVRHALYLLGRRPRSRAELQAALAGSRSSIDRRIRTLKSTGLVVVRGGRLHLHAERTEEMRLLLRELLGADGLAE